MNKAEFDALELGKTRVRFGTGEQEYIVLAEPDVLGYAVIQQVTGPSKGKYYLTKPSALSPAPVRYPTGYQLIYPAHLGQVRSKVASLQHSLRLRPQMTPIAVKKHNRDGSTTLIPWAEWQELEESLEHEEAWEEYYNDH